MKNYAKVAKPLTMLLKKETKWEWGSKEQFAFEELIDRITTAPLLQYPDFEKPFVLTTDASGRALGVVLSQGQIGKDLPVAFASRTLNKAEQNYSTTEREMLAITWGVKHFRPYLYHSKQQFAIVTDHKPLEWVFHTKDPGSRLTHLRIKLEEYNYKVIYKPGKLNTNADALSRMYVVTRAREKLAENLVIEPSKEEIPEILKEYHDYPLGGHPGVLRMLKRIQIKYTWKNMADDIAKYVSACQLCQVNKSGKVDIAPMVIRQTPTVPFQQCSLDIVGPLPDSENGNRYVLTFQDSLTKYSQAIALPDQEANTIARGFVEKIICNYGTPDEVLSDQGPNFLSTIFKNVCKLLQMKKIQTTSYHPQTNGALERSHRTLAEYLRHFINEEQTNWDIWLPYAMFVYNTTPHTATGYTPFFLLYGRHAELPTSLKASPRLTYSFDDYAQELRERMRASYQVAKEKLDAVKLKSKEYYDVKTKTIEYQVGEEVLLKNMAIRRGRSKKLSPIWDGPWTILQKNSEVNYTIQRGGAKCQRKKREIMRVHVNRLKRLIDN